MALKRIERTGDLDQQIKSKTMKMTLNIKKLKDLESRYESSPISLNTLQRMLDIFFEEKESSNSLIDLGKLKNYLIVEETLKDLGVIVIDETKPTQQLNS